MYNYKMDCEEFYDYIPNNKGTIKKSQSSGKYNQSMTSSMCSEDQLYIRLPPETVPAVPSTSTRTGGTDRNDIRDFITERLPPGDRNELDEQLKKTFVLDKTKPKKKPVPHDGRHRTRRKQLTSREKQDLGLYKLPKKGFRYNDFTQLHEMWKCHIKEYLDLQQMEKFGWTATPHDKHQDQLYQRLMKAEYQGCLLKVTRSKCPSFVGIIGIVIMETKNALKIICKDHIIRTVPKQNNVFTFVIDKYMFTIYGNQFKIRPSERAMKKMKTRATIDL